jgi:predicted kinase
MEPAHVPTLYLICGKVAAGKSALAQRLAELPGTLLISEDHWTSHLYADGLKTTDDYGRYAARLRAAMGPHIVDILRRGLSIILDFPANTVRNHNWMRSLIDQSGAAHELHILDVPDTICKQRLQERNAGGKHPFQVSEEEYDLSRVISCFRNPAKASTSLFTLWPQRSTLTPRHGPDETV